MLAELLLHCTFCEHSFSGPSAGSALRDHVMCAHSSTDGVDKVPGCHPSSPPPSNKSQTASSPLLNGLQGSPPAPATFVCSKCNAGFARKDHLEKHDLLHSSAPAVQRMQGSGGGTVVQDENAVLRKFKCPESSCGKAFKFKHHLKEHIRIHSGEKPFECPHCSKRFSHSGSYSSHMTSKKCLIVNLKVRKMDTKAARGRASNSAGGGQQNNTFRPIIPKFGGGGEVSVSSLTASGGYLPDRFSFAGPEYGRGSQPTSQSQVPPPFLPPYASPLTLHHLLASQFPSSTMTHHYLPLGPTFNEMAQLLQARSADKSSPPLSNGNSKMPSADAVKKILEMVDATVTGQNGSPPLLKNNGHLSDVLVAAPLHIQGREESPRDSSRQNFRCRQCKTASFDNTLALFQHERYECTSSRDVNRNMFQNLKPLKTEPPSNDPSGSDTNCDSGDENDLGLNKISAKGMMLLEAAFSINPAPSRDDLSSLAREIGASTRAVRVWFQTAARRQSPHLWQYGTPSASSRHASVRGLLPASSTASTFNGGRLLPSSPSASSGGNAEQPLDLSLRSRTDTQLSNGSATNSDSECEALNLSQKSPKTSMPREAYGSIPNECRDAPERRSPKAVVPYTSTDDYRMSLHARHSASPLLPSANRILALSALKGFDLESQTDLHRYRDAYLDRHHHLSGYPTAPMETSSVVGLLASPHAALSPPTSVDYVRSSGSSDSHDGTNSPHGASNPGDGKMLASSYYHDGDGPADGEPGSPMLRDFRKKEFKEGEVGCGDESLTEDSPSTDDDPRQIGSKKRKLSAKGDSASEEGMFSCDQCDKMFSKQSSLARHKYEHSGQRPHKCDVCDKAFKHKHHLTEHKRLHSGEKPFQCSKCLKRFSHSGSYSQHMNHRFSYCKPYRENGK